MSQKQKKNSLPTGSRKTSAPIPQEQTPAPEKAQENKKKETIHKRSIFLFWFTLAALLVIFGGRWLVAITNAVNLIDGLDGLAAGTSAISALCIGYVAYIHGQYVPTLAMLAIAGAALGFLPYNFHPAKIFMGDGGSQLLGFAIAAFSILGTVKSATIVIVVIPALVLGLPIFDTAFAIIRRVLRHQPIGMADKEHLHHRIMRAGFGQRRAVMLMYCISGIMGIVAVLYRRGYVVEYLGLTAVAIMLIYVLMSDTGNRNVSITASKIKREKDINQEEPGEKEKSEKK